MRFQKLVLFSVGAVACWQATTAAYGQSPPLVGAERSVEQYKCKDILREAGNSRDVAIAFLHGFLLGKSGSSKFNVETLQKQTDAFIERCLDRPQDSAEEVMAQIKK
ncbi:MAG: hypothetical protein EKK40_17440 [Bradyrhizobiaceae bacterium]|nr:MAG: hypothetical protein EKK40_17440 [Bradyrhizobiaceae bacterium]